MSLCKLVDGVHLMTDLGQTVCRVQVAVLSRSFQHENRTSTLETARQINVSIKQID